jgi:hypothetical protein
MVLAQARSLEESVGCRETKLTDSKRTIVFIEEEKEDMEVARCDVLLEKQRMKFRDERKNSLHDEI